MIFKENAAITEKGVPKMLPKMLLKIIADGGNFVVIKYLLVKFSGYICKTSVFKKRWDFYMCQQQQVRFESSNVTSVGCRIHIGTLCTNQVSCEKYNSNWSNLK